MCSCSLSPRPHQRLQMHSAYVKHVRSQFLTYLIPLHSRPHPVQTHHPPPLKGRTPVNALIPPHHNQGRRTRHHLRSNRPLPQRHPSQPHRLRHRHGQPLHRKYPLRLRRHLHPFRPRLAPTRRKTTPARHLHHRHYRRPTRRATAIRAAVPRLACETAQGQAGNGKACRRTNI